jgi:hypothetical protein
MASSINPEIDDGSATRLDPETPFSYFPRLYFLFEEKINEKAMLCEQSDLYDRMSGKMKENKKIKSHSHNAAN